MKRQVPGGFTSSRLPESADPSWLVFSKGKGPGVLILHELPGLSPPTFALGRRIACAGFRVFIPLLFGKVGQYEPARSMIRLCISREWRVLARNESSPIASQLRALCRCIHEECGGPGVGAIGMCLTGNFAITLMLEPSLLAPVLCQPGLPLFFGKAAIGVSPEELECAKRRAAEGVGLLGLRFAGDLKSPKQRFATLRREFGEGFEGHELPGNQHSVLTHAFVGRKGHPTRQALERTIEFLRERLRDR